MSMRHKKIIYACALYLGMSVAFADTPNTPSSAGPELKTEAPFKTPLVRTTQVLWMSEQHRLEAHIATDVMNRLAVANDRIINVFGDDGAFVAQTDEHTGQVFIKPTSDNQQKPLSITIITENGLTQDLTLHPDQPSASSVILKSAYQKSQHASEPRLAPGFSKTSEHSIQEQTIHWLRKAVLGELPEFQGKYSTQKRTHGTLHAKHERRYSAGALWIDVFRLKNTAHQSESLLEKHFFKSGDLAISIQKRTLAPHETTLLYVLVEQ